jgi:NADP-dependent 3-hydroxy acid dehydrogenase YdfG
VAYQRYPGVGHGFGLGTGTSAEGWIADAIRFWAKHIDQAAVATELPQSITERDIAKSIGDFYNAYAIPAESFARAVAFVMSQPEDVDINEILFRPTRQEPRAG